MIYIEEVDTLTKEIYEAIANLLTQLDDTAIISSFDAFEGIIQCPVSHVYIARRKDNNKIVGNGLTVPYYY
jgi:hypothetical protein